MAKIQFGSVVNDARNKTGGIVYSKNKYGSFIRRKVSPAQPRTPGQLAIRAGLTSQSKAWSGTLTAAQRAAWIAFAALNPTHDQFGNAVTLTGLQMFVQVNNILVFAGLAPIASPPPNLTVVGVSAFTAAAAAGAATFAISACTPAPVPAGETFVVYCTKQLPPGRQSINSFYRTVEYFAAAAAVPFDIKALYVAKFGALTAGKVIGVGIRVIVNATGAQSPLFTQIVTVAP